MGDLGDLTSGKSLAISSGVMGSPNASYIIISPLFGSICTVSVDSLGSVNSVVSVSVGLGGSVGLGEVTSGPKSGLDGSVCLPLGLISVKYSLILQVFSCRFRLSARLNFFKQ